MKILAALLLSAAVANAATVRYAATNVFGVGDTNIVRIIPIGSVIAANGGFTTRGPGFRLTPDENGIAVTNLQAGNYLATNAVLGQGILFAVPNDTSTNIYNMGDPGILISGFNTYNYTPGVRVLTAGDGIEIEDLGNGQKKISATAISGASFVAKTGDTMTGLLTAAAGIQTAGITSSAPSRIERDLSIGGLGNVRLEGNAEIYANQLRPQEGDAHALSLNARQAYDSGGTYTIDWDNAQLRKLPAGVTLDWGQRRGYGTWTFDGLNGPLDAGNLTGIIWDGRIPGNIVRTNNIDAVSLLNDSNRVRGVFTAIAGTNGVVTLRRANGTFTNFFGATDTARGAALLAALNAAGGGDVVHLGRGVFDLAGGNATLGTNVSLIGQGRGQTIIVNVSEFYPPLKLTRDNTISSVTLSNSTANGDYVGVRNITSDYGRMVFDDVAIYGYSDGMTLLGTGSVEMRHSYVYGSSDSLSFTGPNLTIALYDSVFECVGPGRSLRIGAGSQTTANSTAIIKDCVFKKSGEASTAFSFWAQSTSRASLFNCTWEVDDGSLHVMNMGGTLTLDATCNFDAEKVSGAFVRAKSYGHSPSEGFLQLMRDGVLDAENMTGTIPDARLSTNVLLATNSLTRNVRFVDAGSGSDNNDGSVVNPWATLTHAQTQTPIGWTIAVLPGTYAGDVTNNSVNYFLHPGASASFAFVHAGTNAISGDGNIEISSTTNDLSISCFIQAKAVTAAPSMSVGAETDLTIHADVVSGLWQPTQTSGTNVVRIVCRKFDGQVTGNTGSGLVGMTLTATESIRMLKGGFNYGSVITAPVLYAVPPTPFFTDTGMPFVWNVGLTRGWTNSVLWPSGMTFVGNPIFDLGGSSITAANATGIYTVR